MGLIICLNEGGLVPSTDLELENKWLRTLRKCHEGRADSGEVVELLNHFIELGIADTVLSMYGYFKIEFIADFVRMSERFGGGLY